MKDGREGKGGERAGTARLPETLETAPNLFVGVDGVKFVYRLFGEGPGPPLVLLQHFSGNMDSWGPAVVNPLAQRRRVVVFDNAGVGLSEGRTPDNVAEMARDAWKFIAALGLTQVDLLGYSIGGFIAQLLAAEHPEEVRRILLVATAPHGGEEHLMQVLADARARRGTDDTRLPLFFTTSEASQAAGRAFLARAAKRSASRSPESGDPVTTPQAKALIAGCATRGPGHLLLNAIRQPALLVSGSHDTMLPAGNAYQMFQMLRNAQLILYPDSGHGVLFQYPDLFVKHVDTFLGG